MGKDPEMRSTGGGTSGGQLHARHQRSPRRIAQGNWQDRTEWHNLVAFTRLAEIVRDYVKKGSKLYVEGKIQTRSWDDKETGAKRYRTEIVVNDISLLSGREEGGSGRLEPRVHGLQRTGRLRSASLPAAQRRVRATGGDFRRRYPL